MGFTEVLTIVFVTLKLLSVIDWSWWLVLLPEIIAVIIYAVCFFVPVIQAAIEARKLYGKNKRRF